MSDAEKIKAALEIGRFLFDLGHDIYEAVVSGDVVRLDKILPQTLLTTLAKAKAEFEASRKFGPRG